MTTVRAGSVAVLIEALDGPRFLVRVIRSGQSKNRNIYPPAVLRESVALFAGARVFAKSDAEHLAGAGKSVGNLIGRLVEPQYSDLEGGEIRAVLELLESAGPVAAKIREALGRGMSDLFGLSIDAQARVVSKGGVRVVEAITRVDSVDLIIEPSAGGEILSLMEAAAAASSSDFEDPMDKVLRECMLAVIREAHGGALPAGLDAEAPDAERLIEAYSAALDIRAARKNAADPAVATDGAKDGEAQAEAIDARFRLIEARSELRVQLAESGLPPVSRDRVRDLLLRDSGLTTERVVESIKQEREYLAKLTESGRPAGLGGGDIYSPADQADKLKARFDALFDRSAKGPRSIREAYIALTGDTRVTGELRECDARRLREASALLPEALRESVSTATFSNILCDSITRRMLAEYSIADAVLDWWRTVVEVVPISDFRTNERTRMGGYGSLPAVAQGAPYLALTTPGEEHESYAVTKRGGTEQVSLETVRNDDMGVIQRIPGKLAKAGKRTLSEFVAAFFSSNPAMADGENWFSSAHGNVGSTALSGTSLAATRLLVMKHAELTSGKRLGIPPRNLLVPLDLEETAFDLFRKTTNNDQDFVEALQMRVIPVWAWTDATDWVSTVDPMEIPFLELGFLDGSEEPSLFVQDSPTAGSLFTHDQITYKIRHIYGGAPTDYRGVYKHVVAN